MRGIKLRWWWKPGYEVCGLYFGGNTTQVKVLSMDDMMKAVHFKEILICYKYIKNSKAKK